MQLKSLLENSNIAFFGGAFAPAGMESFSDILRETDIDAIHAYLIDQARQGYNEQQKSRTPD